MGGIQSEGYAEAVREGVASLRAAVAANLSSNHYPPVPQAYVEPILEAIKAVNEGQSRRNINIGAVRSTGMIPLLAHEVGGYLMITAADLVQISHSWPFCDDHDEED